MANYTRSALAHEAAGIEDALQVADAIEFGLPEALSLAELIRIQVINGRIWWLAVVENTQGRRFEVLLRRAEDGEILFASSRAAAYRFTK